MDYLSKEKIMYFAFIKKYKKRGRGLLLPNNTKKKKKNKATKKKIKKIVKDFIMNLYVLFQNR